MKRPAIIVSAAACAIWLLILPLLVGLYLRTTLPEWTAGWPESETLHFKPGWFRSNLSWTSADGIELDLRARHVPPLRIGLLRVEGSVRSPATPEPARVNGHIGLAGGWNLQATIAQVRDSGRLAFEARDVMLNVAQPSGQAMTLVLSARQIGPDPVGGGSPLGPMRLMARQRLDEGRARHLDLELQLFSGTLGQGVLFLSAGPADPVVLGELIEGLAHWAGSEPSSLDQRLALLGIAGTWQQLASAGLMIRMEQLRLGRQTQIQASWLTQQPQPRISGRGRTAELSGWYAAIASLAGQAPGQAELSIEARLRSLAQNGWIQLDGEQFEITGFAAQDDGRPALNP